MEVTARLVMTFEIVKFVGVKANVETFVQDRLILIRQSADCMILFANTPQIWD